MEKVDLNKLNNLVTDGLLKCREHPSGELLIFNYTDRCQYEKIWTPETLMCRGLITDKEGKIVARPFPKFFNLNEHLVNSTLPNEPFEVYEKLDGSLGILYFWRGEPYIASRGSFDSTQALKATDMLKNSEGYNHLNPEYTYLFEIIYPENRIVVNYGEEESLNLLAIIETKTGKETNIYDSHVLNHFPKVVKFEYHRDIIDSLITRREPNKEGFVIRFESGLRVKYKFEEYVQLHSFITEVTTKKIWSLLKDSIPFDELLSKVPDELYQWVRDKEKQLMSQFDHIRERSKIFFESIKFIENRKEFAEVAKTFDYPHILFAMLDKKDYKPVIWKLIEPETELPIWNKND